MPEEQGLKVLSLNGELSSFIPVKDFVLNWSSEFYYPDAVFQTVIAELQSTRLARPHTKTKGEVSGGGKKPYRQKHTGRARQGSRRNPQFVGGGTAFGPRNVVNHYKKVNKQVRALAIRSCWTQAIGKGKIFVIDSKEIEGFPENKTKTIASLIKKTNCNSKRVFVLVKGLDEKIVLGARNIKDLEVRLVSSIPANTLMKSTTILLSMEGFEWLKENYFKKWK